MIKSVKLVSFLFIALSAKSAVALDFLQALELAEKSDPEMMAARFHYQAILEARPQSESALLPEIDVDVFTKHSRQTTSDSSNTALFPNESFSFDTDGYKLSLTQPVYNHRLYLSLQQTDISIAQGAAEIEAAKQSLIIRVAEAYYKVLAAKDNLKFARAEKNAIGQQLEQTQQRFNVGLIAITDVKEAQASYDISVAQEISAENLLAIGREALRSIINQQPKKLNSLTEKIPLFSPQPADIDQWAKIATKNNLALKSAQYVVELANKQVDINRSEHYPSLGLSVQHSYSSPDGGNFVVRDTEDTSVTLNLNIPIYSGGYTNSKMRQAVAEMNKARSLRDRAHRQAEQQSRESHLGVTTSIAQVKAFKQALASTQSAYEATQAGFEVGTRTAVDVLSALREQYRSERDYAQARYTYIIELLRLKQAAGILSKIDVQQVNRWLKH